jgi:hypothetical protein
VHVVIDRQIRDINWRIRQHRTTVHYITNSPLKNQVALLMSSMSQSWFATRRQLKPLWALKRTELALRSMEEGRVAATPVLC